MEKCTGILKNQNLFNDRLKYLETKLELEGSQEGSVAKKRLEVRLESLSKSLVKEGLESSQIDVLLEDLTPLIDDLAKHISNLKIIEDYLADLEEGLPLKTTLKESYIEILARAEDLHKNLSALQTNRSFFKENGALFNKIYNIFFEYWFKQSKQKSGLSKFYVLFFNWYCLG